MHSLLFVDDEVRESVNADIVKHPIIGAARSGGELSHFEVYLWYERVEADFLMLPLLILPLEVGKECWDDVSRFHDFLYYVPTSTKDFVLWF